MERFAVPLSCLLLLCATAVRAEGESAPEPDWQFSIAPYVWLAGLEGTAEAGGTTADVDIPFSDIWNALDASVMGTFEARRGKLSIASNLIYLKLSTSGETPIGSVLPPAPPGSFGVRLAVDTILFEVRPAWEVLSLPVLGPDRPQRLALDVGPAARGYWMDTHVSVKLDPGAPLGPFSRRFDETISWVDLLAAARVRAQLCDSLSLVVAGDFGGFDIGSSSHKTWSLAGVLSYRLGEHWDLAAGWRTLEIERGPVDLEMAGPLLGATYRF
jgi:hypothetical protein